MPDDSRLIWFERLVRTRQWGQAEHLISVHTRNLWDGGDRKEAISMSIECGNILLQAGGIGEAADMFTHAAVWLMALGDCDGAATLYSKFADELLHRKLYGWAASRYYDAAMSYIAKGRIKDAAKVLEATEPNFHDIPGEEFWRRQYSRDLAVLRKDAGELLKLSELERVFRDAGRDDWARCCESGISFLATGRIAAA